LQHQEFGSFDMRARFLIDATGRQASVCRQIGVDTKKADQLMGVGAFLQLGDGRSPAHNVVLETVESGWWYSAILSQDTMTVVYFSDADLISKHGYHKTDNWNLLLQETKQVKQLVKGAHSHEGVWTRNAHTQISHSPVCKAFLAIGDAAVSFDPVSSMGIGFAITSACQAAAIVQAELSAPDPQRIAVYQADLERHFDQYLTLRKKIYAEERRWPSSAFWQRRQGLVRPASAQGY
jgi:flavin-dependent dehydrogenase